MQIESYFQKIRDTVDHCDSVQDVAIDYDRRDKSTGFIRGTIIFRNGSILHVREFISTIAGVNRLMYSYQYMDAAKHLLFRYDNADHHRHLNLPTHPHHKHDGSEETIVAATGPTVAAVLAEIEPLVQLL
ncbi:MAG: DUF6516 family protein [Chloroflexi bacterium]|nr:DUF6516 family protein [Chloroflexota bacterium]